MVLLSRTGRSGASRWGEYTRVTLLILLAFLLVPARPAVSKAASDWPTRGGNPNRPQAANPGDASLQGVLSGQPAFSVESGQTGSQPILVNGQVYQMAGNAVWRIDPTAGTMEELVRFGSATGPVSTSSLTYQVVNGAAVLYLATADNRVCAFRPDAPQTTLQCVELQKGAVAPRATEPPVMSPYVLKVSYPGGQETDVVIMGDKAGRIWAIQNLAITSRPGDTDSTPGAFVNFLYVGGWILATPVAGRTPGEFVWGADASPKCQGGGGYIGLMQVVPSDGTGPPRLLEVPGVNICTPRGITDGFAKDGDYIYAADKSGMFYKINPRVLSIQKYDYACADTPHGAPRCSSSNNRRTMFLNASPAIDDQYVYFAIRNWGSLASPTTPGRLVAINKHDFTTVAWAADLEAPANTNPLAWVQEGAGYVLVGDRKGKLYAFDRAGRSTSPSSTTGGSGEAAAGGTATTTAPQPAYLLNAGGEWQPTFTATGEPAQDCQQHSYQATVGTTDPILASGWLITGASGRREGRCTGVLTGYRVQPGVNLAWQPTTCPIGGQELQLDTPATLQAQLTLDPRQSGATTMTTGLNVFWVPTAEEQARGARVRRLQPGTDHPAAVTLTPGTPTQVTIRFTPRESDGAQGSLKAFVNPHQLLTGGGPVAAEYRRLLSLALGHTPDTLENYYAAGNVAALYQAAGGGLGGSPSSGPNGSPSGTDPGTATPATPGIPANAPPGLAELPGLLADNLLPCDLRISAPVNLAVSWVQAPSQTVKCNLESGSFPVRWAYRNDSTRTLSNVMVDIRVHDPQTGEELTRIIRDAIWRLPPGEQSDADEVPLFQVGCDRELEVVVQINMPPYRRIEETPQTPGADPYADNRQTARVRVGPYPRSGTFAPGRSGDVIIVPADCIQNPDPYSRQPCVNYPDLRYPDP